MNMAPGAYVQTVRIDAARRLLADGAPALARVAQRCGFASEEAMRMAFQRHLGVSPARFREQAREGKTA